MKIVCIGDALIPSSMMRRWVEKFPRYTEAEYFDFGPHNRDEIRMYVKKMEAIGFDCEPLPDKIIEAAKDADVIQVHLAPISKVLLERTEKLKLILSNRGGLENIDLQTASKRSIAVLCNPAHNANAVAEMTIGLLLAETRNIARNHMSLALDGRWYENPPNAGRIHELSSMTVGLAGFGTIGRIVVNLLRAFRTKILVYDPFVSAAEIEACGATPVTELSDLLKGSDVVSLHARVSEQTKGMIGAAELNMMRPGAILINTARPALIDMDALYVALNECRISGAAIDVFPIEPIPPDYPLLSLKNVTLTCHKGGDTVESYADSPEMVLKEGETYFTSGIPQFWANSIDMKR